MPYYAVAKGRTSGIFMNWADCETQVKGFPGARYKKFNSAVDAEKFILSEGGSGVTKNNGKRKTIANTLTATNSQSRENDNSSSKTAKKRTSKILEDNHISSDEEFDDLNSILNKQMDDIEKRLKGFEKGVDNIIKKKLKASDKKTMLIDPPQPKKHKKGKLEFVEDQDGYVQVWI